MELCLCESIHVGYYSIRIKKDNDKNIAEEKREEENVPSFSDSSPSFSDSENSVEEIKQHDEQENEHNEQEQEEEEMNKMNQMRNSLTSRISPMLIILPVIKNYVKITLIKT